MLSDYAVSSYSELEYNGFSRIHFEGTLMLSKPHPRLSLIPDTISSVIFISGTRPTIYGQAWKPSSGLAFEQGCASIHPLKFRTSLCTPLSRSGGVMDTITIVQKLKKVKTKKFLPQRAAARPAKTPERIERSIADQAKNTERVKTADMDHPQRISTIQSPLKAKEARTVRTTTQRPPSEMGEHSYLPSNPESKKAHVSPVLPKKSRSPASPTIPHELVNVPSDPKLVMKHCKAIQGWKTILEYSTRAKQRKTCNSYKAILGPVAANSEEVLRSLQLLLGMHSSQLKEHQKLWDRATVEQQEFSKLKEDMQEMLSFSTVAGRISTDIEARVIALTFLRDLRNREMWYCKFQADQFQFCEHLLLHGLESSEKMTCNDSRSRGKEVRRRKRLSETVAPPNGTINSLQSSENITNDVNAQYSPLRASVVNAGKDTSGNVEENTAPIDIRLAWRSSSNEHTRTKIDVSIVSPDSSSSKANNVVPSGIKIKSTPRLRAPNSTYAFGDMAFSYEGTEQAVDSDHQQNESASNMSHSQTTSSSGENGDNESVSSPQDGSLSGGDDFEGNMSNSNPPSDGEDESDDGSEQSSSESDEGEQEEEHIPLTFQIPAETLRTAMSASPNSGAAYWRHDMYRGPEDEKILVHYCRNMEVSERVAKHFVDKKVLGFDIEWKPNASPNDGIKGNVSLIQLACEDRIGLFHISLFKGTTLAELLPPTIKQIMESPDITKAGVAIKGDCTRLQKYLGIEARGIFELSHLYKLVKFSVAEPKKVNKTLVALAKQVEEHLQLPLGKGSVRSSDWTAPLLYEQVLYAASDAYAGFRLYDALEAKRKKLKPTPPRPFHAELNKPIRLASGVEAEAVAVPKPCTSPAEEESDASEYETAPEELEDSDAETSSLELSDEDDDEVSESSDEEFVPPVRRVGRVGLLSTGLAVPTKHTASEEVEAESSEESSSSTDDIPTLTSRIGRVGLATSSANPTNTPATSSEATPSSAKPPPPLHTPEYRTAELWVQTWRLSRPPTRKIHASASQLRAYALWHVQSLELADVARHMRTPPLAVSTVASYVLSAVMLEGLEAERERVRCVLGEVPGRVRERVFGGWSRRWVGEREGGQVR